MAVTRAERMPDKTPVRPGDAVVKRLNALADLHTKWVQGNAGAAGFKPEEHPKMGSDYNIHHVDLDAQPAALDEFHQKASKIFAGERKAPTAADPALSDVLRRWPDIAAPMVDELAQAAADAITGGTSPRSAP